MPVSANLHIEGGLVYFCDERDNTWEIFHITTICRIRVMTPDFNPQRTARATYEIYLEFEDGERSPPSNNIHPHVVTTTELKALLNTWQRFNVRKYGT